MNTISRVALSVLVQLGAFFLGAKSLLAGQPTVDLTVRLSSDNTSTGKPIWIGRSEFDSIENNQGDVQQLRSIYQRAGVSASHTFDIQLWNNTGGPKSDYTFLAYEALQRTGKWDKAKWDVKFYLVKDKTGKWNQSALPVDVTSSVMRVVRPVPFGEFWAAGDLASGQYQLMRVVITSKAVKVGDVIRIANVARDQGGAYYTDVVFTEVKITK